MLNCSRDRPDAIHHVLLQLNKKEPIHKARYIKIPVGPLNTCYFWLQPYSIQVLLIQCVNEPSH